MPGNQRLTSPAKASLSIEESVSITGTESDWNTVYVSLLAPLSLFPATGRGSSEFPSKTKRKNRVKIEQGIYLPQSPDL